MFNKLKKMKKDKVQLAFEAASKAAAKVLGKNPDRDCLCEVALLVSHASVTADGNLDLTLARRNAEIFCSQLMALVERTQHNSTSGSAGCGRLL